ncbi:flagellar hook-basal body complex protein [Puniceibacterium sediminis]|uniref:Flagellar basal-body rod protein FlgF n=1 Tax=Puniceibacterium sediminis TaxID=1608407 RepID=A0A238WTG9_9RHOB|nr:flagellar hook-basal body complex protein [Puniceibacterium sediminis]SNR49830.1 flagellar basal-body rod protein FlgF [Puniceibacterium sediminis]
METAGYTTLTRQSGLMREMQVIANNIANTATTGFRQEGVVFAEFIARTDMGSISMATAQIHNTSTLQGTLTKTGGQFDIGIQGDGFFLVQTPNGDRLTRAGAFTPNANGDLVTPDGYPVLDAGGAPIFIPPDAGDLAIAQDGTLSSQGRPLGQVGVVQPTDFNGMIRENGTFFESTDGFEPVEQPMVMQGFLESSNVNAVGQIARMIEVQRAYEMGQNFLQAENERITNAIKTFIR